MEEMSISLKTESKNINIAHNNRALTEEQFAMPQHSHIIRELSKNNIYVVQENIKETYHQLFDKYLEDYNSKQHRKDRKIENYYKHVRNSKTLDLQREFIVTIGNQATWQNLPYELKKKVGEALKKYVLNFNKRHKQFHVYNAVIHLDESGAPHAHFNVIPLATGYKKGLEVQPSFRKVLENLGYTGSEREKFTAFRNSEVAVIEDIMKELDITRKLVGTNNFKDSYEYKEAMQEVEKEMQLEREKRLTKLEEELVNKVNQVQKMTIETAEILDQKNQVKKELTLAKYNLQQTYYEHLNVSNNISQLNENLKVLKQEKELQQKDLTKLSHQSNEKQLELLKVSILQKTKDLMDNNSLENEDVRQNTFNKDEVIMKRKKYLELHQKAQLFTNIEHFIDAITNTIKDSVIYKNLKLKIRQLKKITEDLKNENSVLKKENKQLIQEVNTEKQQAAKDRQFKQQFERYLKQSEKEEIRNTLQRRMNREKQLKNNRQNDMER